MSTDNGSIELITRNAAAKILGISPPTVQAWIEKGLLTYYRNKLGQIRLSRKEVEDKAQYSKDGNSQQ